MDKGFNFSSIIYWTQKEFTQSFPTQHCQYLESLSLSISYMCILLEAYEFLLNFTPLLWKEPPPKIADFSPISYLSDTHCSCPYSANAMHAGCLYLISLQIKSIVPNCKLNSEVEKSMTAFYFGSPTFIHL